MCMNFGVEKVRNMRREGYIGAYKAGKAGLMATGETCMEPIRELAE